MKNNYKLWFTNIGGTVAGVMLDTYDGSPIITGSELTSIVIGTVKTWNGKTEFSSLYITRFILDCPNEAQIIKSYIKEKERLYGNIMSEL